MTPDQIKTAFDSFFHHDKQKVLLLKGPWGAGKSFFTRQYLSNPISFAPEYQYFVSLFGLSTLAEVREAMNANLAIRGKKSNIPVGKEVSAVAEKALTQAGPAVKYLNQIPKVAGIDLGAVGASLFWLYAKRQKSVVVFDDLERSNISIKNVLGLASSLAENSKAKVVIIFNEDELKPKEIAKLNAYREKVIDIEILFDPPTESLVEKYLVNKNIRAQVNYFLSGTRSNNIRIIQKINFNLERFENLVSKDKIKLSDEELARAAKIVCLRYLSKKQLSPKMIEGGLWGLSLNKKSETKDDKQLSELAKSLKIFPPYPLDPLIFELIQNGYCSEESKRGYFDKYQTNQSRDKFNSDLAKAYSRYGDNFSGTVEQVFSDMEVFLNKYSKEIATQYFVPHLIFLSNLGYTKTMEPWKKSHLEYIKKLPKVAERIDAARSLLPSEAVSVYISFLGLEERSAFDPREIIRRIIKTQSWNPEDVETLASMSEDEIYEWVCSTNDNLFIDDLRSIYKFWSGTDSATSYWNKLDAVLKRLATRSKLDAMRVKDLFYSYIKS